MHITHNVMGCQGGTRGWQGVSWFAQCRKGPNEESPTHARLHLHRLRHAISDSAAPPRECLICEEERQFVPPSGQQWTTLDALAVSHPNVWRQPEPGVLSLGNSFGIGQRAMLLQTDGGNVLFDCVATIDDATVTMIKGLGGLKAIAISHPHYYTTMGAWADAFDCPVYLHEADREWVVKPSPRLVFWSGETRRLWDGVTLICAGGHYPGGTVLHWARGQGILCVGDIITIVSDRKWCSFMRSYPNLIPLSAREVRGIGAALQHFTFDTMYGHFFDRVIEHGAKEALEKSIERYIAAINGTRGY